MMLVDKESGKSYVQMEETTGHKKEYASKATANTALGFGIGSAALWLLNGGLNNLGLFGGKATTDVAKDERYLERKECQDVLDLTVGLWQKSYNDQAARFADREIINKEMFGLYSTMRNGFDAINVKHNEDAFNLYKYSRDSKDELSGEIGALKTELAVLKATRPYQDALIQCDIKRVAEHADFNLWRRTCRMISGEVVLPNTPVISGYGSYNPCACPSQTTASSAE